MPFAFSPDGRTLASGSYGYPVRLKLWDVTTRQNIAALSEGRLSGGRFEDRENEDHSIRLWNVMTADLLKILTGHTKRVTSVALSPDSNILASGSRDRTIRLWDVESGQEKAVLRGHTNDVYSVSYSPDGLTLASGSSDGTILL